MAFGSGFRSKCRGEELTGRYFQLQTVPACNAATSVRAIHTKISRAIPFNITLWALRILLSDPYCIQREFRQAGIPFFPICHVTACFNPLASPPKGRDAEKRCRLGRVVSNQEKGRSIKEFLMQSHDVSVSLAHAGMPSDIFRPGASVGWNTVDRRSSFFPDAGGQPQRLSRHKKRIRQLLII